MRFCSNGGSNCLVVERCIDGKSIDLRDSKLDGERPHRREILHVEHDDFAAFLAAAKDGSVDHLLAEVDAAEAGRPFAG
jgi:hypothetical protein